MNTLASNLQFYTHGIIPLFLIGLIAFGTGVLVGWLAWKKGQAQTARLEKLNSGLKDTIAQLKASATK